MPSISATLARFRVDPYILVLFAAIGVATLLPASGGAAVGLGYVTKVAIGLLFFLYGARLSPQAALEGLRHWRLHLVILVATFVLFPLLGLASGVLVPAGVLTEPLYVGLVFLCALPSTVQSSIAFTSLAKGNVAAAICAASFSNLVGVLLTPLLVALLLSTSGGGFSLGSVVDILVQLLVPFLLGQLVRRWIIDWVQRHKKVLGLLDRGVIVLTVYAAFSEGMVAGIWHQLSVGRLLLLLLVNAVLLAAVMAATGLGGRWLGFSREDRIAIVFCGSKKSLASGLPMATVLFAGQSVGLIVLPLMLFHQMQLMVCAWLARRYAATAAPERQPELHH
ncbi:bile acid:sodium symporter family protein [Goodfellowiella coeruleoviolacea]|uniref:Solute carrier family 10 (Sodium/bile acid cotransporter), member 7 n=1 Tax=Goodfellowiella coeruleoviolacea TaxID=334858 RepID=A0AAE3GDY3_9PSEU|nr:bile acid:sodium symporter family protein [Goodfellowiella coeruleoviolacea]MCP2166526.1 solute carrier family 10 (sodium/bile acid cotransporter), member 7 [Goodfellowiella coeruleoviolacea]